jgi:nicotinamide-nucleotide adenylyltransferase
MESVYTKRLGQISEAFQAFLKSGKSYDVISTIKPQASPSCSTRQAKQIVVMDSSFNPPTRAHRALVVSALGEPQCNNHLVLLLAVKNADKAPVPAPFPYRLLMMEMFAQNLLGTLATESSQRRAGLSGIDVAVTTLPYFHEKGQAIAAYDAYKIGPDGPGLLFLAGYDTLIRIFDPKYYESRTSCGLSPMQTALSPFFKTARLRITMRTDDKWGGKGDQRDYLRGLANGGLDRIGGSNQWAHKVELVEGIEGNDGALSSTSARTAAATGDERRLEQQVDQDIKQWILQTKVYS